MIASWKFIVLPLNLNVQFQLFFLFKNLKIKDEQMQASVLKICNYSDYKR